MKALLAHLKSAVARLNIAKLAIAKLVGAAVITVGVGMVFVPAGLIVGGCLMILFAMAST